MIYETIVYFFIIFLYGIIIGSFLNVCIIRIPQKENITTTRSHCRKCGYLLQWYDLIPLFSYIILKGRCRKCGKKISMQYPIVEGLNGLLYVIIFAVYGVSYLGLLYCFLASALIVLSVIDFKTYVIPGGINVFIGLIAVFRVMLDRENMGFYLLGFCCVSSFLLIIYIATKGRGIGGGDIKLMAVSGLLLGFQQIIVAFIFGCILGSILHLIRMKLSNRDRVLAFGPYLSMGILLSILYGNQIVAWYLNLLHI